MDSPLPKKSDWYRSLSVLILSLILVCLPRFNRNQLIFKRPPADLAIYEAYIDYFKTGEINSILVSKDSIAANWRPLMPFLASKLPFKPVTALSILSILFLIGAVFFLKKSLIFLNLKPNLVWLGSYLFVFSFPTFYYSTIGSVDAGLIFFLSLGVYLLIREEWIKLAFIFFIGAFAKEGIVLLLPAAIIYLYQTGRLLKKSVYPAGYLLICIAAFMFIRIIAPNSGFNYNQFWTPSWKMFDYNIHRLNSWLSFILTFGIPGLLFTIIIVKKGCTNFKNNPVIPALFVGFISAVLTYIFAFITTVADGRTVWASYPFLIPLSMLLMNQIEINQGEPKSKIEH